MANQIPVIIDPVKFARQGENISGQIDLAKLSRLNASLSEQTAELAEHQDDSNATTKSSVENSGALFFELDFSLKGRAYVASGSYQTEVNMVCQRCLETMRIPLAESMNLEFVIYDSKDDSVDAESSLEGDDYDVVFLTDETVKLQNLIEDELLLALPFAPTHEEHECPATQQINELQTKDTQDQDKPNPFAVLADLAILKKDQES